MIKTSHKSVVFITPGEYGQVSLSFANMSGKDRLMLTALTDFGPAPKTFDAFIPPRRHNGWLKFALNVPMHARALKLRAEGRDEKTLEDLGHHFSHPPQPIRITIRPPAERESPTNFQITIV